MAETLFRAIDSVLQQTYQNWELLVLDDGSTDNSVKIATQFDDTRIKVLKSEKHLGFAAQLNRGIEVASGEYFARMDADDVMLPTRLEKQVDSMKLNPEIDLLGTALAVLGTDGKLKFNRYFPTLHSQIIAYPWNGFGVAHPTWLGKTAWFRKWGYRDFERYEDQELLLRSHKTSRFANLEEPLHGYLSEKTKIDKQFKARKSGFVVLSIYFFKQKKYGICLLVIGVTFIKILKDLAMVLTKN